MDIFVETIMLFSGAAGYRGTFDVEWLQVDRGAVPPHVRPLRQERRR